MLTQELLKQYLHYDSILGTFTRIKTRRGKFSKDIEPKHAGSLHHTGYRFISLFGKRYLEHRLAWFYIYGVWPDELDHKDTVKHHNWITNLREVSKSGNQQNRTKPMITNKSTGLLGASFSKSHQKFVAKIWDSGRVRHIGYYDTKEEAHHAYLEVKRQVHLTCTI